eukprot:IDg22182t1
MTRASQKGLVIGIQLNNRNVSVVTNSHVSSRPSTSRVHRCTAHACDRSMHNYTPTMSATPRLQYQHAAPAKFFVRTTLCSIDVHHRDDYTGAQGAPLAHVGTDSAASCASACPVTFNISSRTASGVRVNYF